MENVTQQLKAKFNKKLTEQNNGAMQCNQQTVNV